jgi:hypothetical protein
MLFKRRDFLISVSAFMGGCASNPIGKIGGQNPSNNINIDELINDIKKRTFNFFWETTNPQTGATPDRWPSPSASSIAGIGMALTTYAIGVENAYISREQAKTRTLNTLRFLWGLKQGPEARGNAGYKGFFYHFINTTSGERLAQCELSTIDTALLMAGVLFVGDFYSKDDDQELEIRQLSHKLFNRVEWNWALNANGVFSMGWHPETGFIKSEWAGFNEAMILYLMAIGAQNNAIPANCWANWARTYNESWGNYKGQEHLIFPPHFGHQYSHLWVDFKNIQDDYMRAKSMDYFENSRRATFAQRSYAMANPKQWEGYGENIWGITACDGPLDAILDYKGQKRQFITYAGRGAGIKGNENTYDDGTLAPTAAIASLPFAPEIVKPAIKEMHAKYGENIYSQYGFWDSFNPSFQYDLKPQHGKIIKGFGWVDGDYLAIDQGPIVMMIENYQTQLIWKIMRDNSIIRRGLVASGFKGGYLEAK